MSSFRIRPRFREELPLDTLEYTQKLKTALDSSAAFTGMVSENYAVIKIPREERHYWSPQLALTIEPYEDKKAVFVRGLYGPKPSVWAVFFMSYAALGIVSLFVGVFGLSQIMLEKPAPILWAIPGFAVIALIMYLVAQAGQKVGAEQMYRIHHFYEGLFEDKVRIS